MSHARSERSPRVARRAATAALAAAALAACGRAPAPSASDAGAPSSAVEPASPAASGGAASSGASAAAATPLPPDAPRLAIIGLQANVYERPTDKARKLGYLRLGAVVAREPKPAGNDACPGGWYRVQPRGYVCVGDDASLDVDHPLAKAGALRPDLTKPMPYAYAFVRAVAPMYLKLPSKDEQLAAEFKLQDHLDWWRENGAEANKVVLGANDVVVDARGVPVVGAKPARPSPTLSESELFGGRTANDPVPFWLDGGRKVPNISDFKVPAYAAFADRVRRHTGLSLIGAVSTGPDAFERRFAITTDLRLVPGTKLKPDTGSPWHGVELDEQTTLPLGFVRATCDAGAKKKNIMAIAGCAHAYRLDGERAREDAATLPWRSIVPLSGKSRKVGATLYRETRDGRWLKASDLGVAEEPAEKPPAAKAGQKWIDISIENQVLVLWEGARPIYATLVSTGQDGMKDPKTTKSTVRGTFRIKYKHVTTTMDSNEGLGGAEAKAVDPSYGKTVRRGQGQFKLTDVPWVEYFEQGYALHAAYWHDVFGTARSHGCVNLSPVDAHRVFLWTDPPVPDGWHAVLTGPETPEGTTVTIHK